jgi:hypothetical protein
MPPSTRRCRAARVASTSSLRFCVRTDSRQAAEMVQYDRQIGHLFGEGRELGQLREAEPGVERQPHPRKHARAGLVFGACQHFFHLPALDLGMRIPGDRGVLRLFSVERTRDFPKKPVYLLGTGECVETPDVNQMGDFTRSPLPRRRPRPLSPAGSPCLAPVSACYSSSSAAAGEWDED